MGAKWDEDEPNVKSPTELRKINKPLVERRRRERINSCLEELKTLILDATKRETCRYSKLEKADILEMTVRHLKTVQKQHISGSSDAHVMNKYRSGFSECASEVTSYLSKVPGLSPEVQARMLGHLRSCLRAAEYTCLSKARDVPPGRPCPPQGYLPTAGHLPVVAGYTVPVVPATPVFAIHNSNVVIGLQNNDASQRFVVQSQSSVRPAGRPRNDQPSLPSNLDQLTETCSSSETNCGVFISSRNTSMISPDKGRPELYPTKQENQPKNILDVNGNFSNVIGQDDLPPNPHEDMEEPEESNLVGFVNDNEMDDVWRPW